MTTINQFAKDVQRFFQLAGINPTAFTYKQQSLSGVYTAQWQGPAKEETYYLDYLPALRWADDSQCWDLSCTKLNPYAPHLSVFQWSVSADSLEELAAYYSERLRTPA